MSAIAYDANGRTRDADVAIAADDVTETYVGGVLEQSRDVAPAERDRIAAARRA